MNAAKIPLTRLYRKVSARSGEQHNRPSSQPIKGPVTHTFS